MNKVIIFGTTFITTFILLKYKNSLSQKDQNEVNLNYIFNEFDHKHLNNL